MSRPHVRCGGGNARRCVRSRVTPAASCPLSWQLEPTPTRRPESTLTSPPRRGSEPKSSSPAPRRRPSRPQPQTPSPYQQPFRRRGHPRKPRDRRGSSPFPIPRRDGDRRKRSNRRSEKRCVPLQHHCIQDNRIQACRSTSPPSKTRLHTEGIAATMPTLRLLPELEEALRQVPGIRAASVVTGPDAVPTEIHIVASRSKGAKQVVRDVQSLAMAGYDIDIDHRIVSVVQFDDDIDDVRGDDNSHAIIRMPDTAPAIDTLPRPVIAAITIRTAGSEADASVVVRTGNSSYDGRSIGPSTMSHRHTLIARATLDAVSELLGLPAEVEFVTVSTMGTRRMAACVIQVAVPGIGELVLTGSALVRSDEADAVARAVLDALNRRLAG